MAKNVWIGDCENCGSHGAISKPTNNADKKALKAFTAADAVCADCWEAAWAADDEKNGIYQVKQTESLVGNGSSISDEDYAQLFDSTDVASSDMEPNLGAYLYE